MYSEPDYIIDPCFAIRPDGSIYILEVSLIRNPNKGDTYEKLKNLHSKHRAGGS